jgi:hypothetical protein
VTELITAIRELQEAGGEYGSTMTGYEVVTTEQSIKLLIGSYQNCCERWGYFWCNEKPSDFVGAEVRGVSLTDTALSTKALEANDAHAVDDGDVMFVNIETDRGVLQFVAYNSHNGYYGHEARVECRQLKHTEHL